jgi:septal ring factor EnvC (AmiA/AmiB activator)
MLAKLQAEGGADATEKAFCDEETAKSEAQRDDLDATISKLTTKIDAKVARSASLKADVKELQDELAKLAGEEAKIIPMSSGPKRPIFSCTRRVRNNGTLGAASHGDSGGDDQDPARDPR